MAVEEFFFDVCLEILFWIALHVVFEIAVQILMGLGFSRLEAEGLAMAFVFAVLLLLAAITAYRRKKLGKAVVLDTDGDGRISEEEEAAAFGDEEDSEEWWGGE